MIKIVWWKKKHKFKWSWHRFNLFNKLTNLNQPDKDSSWHNMWYLILFYLLGHLFIIFIYYYIKSYFIFTLCCFAFWPELIFFHQKQNRLQDAKTVEEKAAKIKEWVMLKLSEVNTVNCCLCCNGTQTYVCALKKMKPKQKVALNWGM